MNAKKFSLLLLSFLIIGCAAPEYELPATYSGPTATLQNNVNKSAGALHSELLSVVEINGVPDKRSPVVTTGPYGTYKLTDATISREIPAGKSLVKIRISRLHAAPIVALADSVTRSKQELSGDVYFNALPNKTYIVKGSLAKGNEAVWLQDTATGKMVGRKIQ